MRFSASHDIVLLKEVLSQKPEGPDGWRLIASRLNGISGMAEVTSRTCRERTERLLKQFKINDVSNLRKSGTEEEYSEKESLLQELVDRQREQDLNKETNKSGGTVRPSQCILQDQQVVVESNTVEVASTSTANVPQETTLANQEPPPPRPSTSGTKRKTQEMNRQIGATIRENALNRMVNDDSEEGKPKKRMTRESVFNYMEKKSSAELSVRKEEIRIQQEEKTAEMDLRRRELELQREKFEEEKRVAEVRLDMEKKERELKQQHDLKMLELMNALIQKNSK